MSMAMPQLNETNSGWFASLGEHDSYFQTANELWEGRREWAREAADEAGQPLTAQEKDIDALYSLDKEELQDRIVKFDGDMLVDDLAERTRDQLRITALRYSNWRSGRKSSTGRKIATGFQEFLCTFGDFLENFSGIVDIVKGADQQYGGLAYGTLSLLLAVAVKKQQREDAVEEGMEELTYAFPRLNILRDLQPSQRLQKLIADVFGQVIIFARESAGYYSSRLRRTIDALSPAKSKMKTLSRIRKLLAQVRQESEILMLQDISSMRQTIEKMSGQLRSTHATVLAHRDSASEEHLARIRHILGIKAGSPHMNLPEYKALLGRAFDARRAKVRVPLRTTIELLAEDSSFSKWLTSPRSAFLLVGARNWQMFTVKDLTWLSEGSVLLAESLTKQNEKVAWFLCQTDWTVTTRTRCRLQTMLATLLYQVILMHPTLLRSKQDRLQALTACVSWKSNNADDILTGFVELLSVILDDFDKDSILYIIIDRLDQCQWHDDEGLDGWNMRLVIDRFLELMTASKCLLKVVAVVASASAQVLSAYCSSVRDDRLIFKPEWSQKLR